MTNTPDGRPRERRFVAGLTLALIGVALFWLNVTDGASHALIMAAIGAAFLVGYFTGHGYGLLIPGCILAGLGLGELADNVWWGDFSQLGLGLGFIAIYVIDRLYRGETSWWPLIPGGIITFSALGAEVYSIRRAVEVGWPLIFVLIGLGLMAGFGKRRNRHSRHDDSSGGPPQAPPPESRQDPPQGPHTGV